MRERRGPGPPAWLLPLLRASYAAAPTLTAHWRSSARAGGGACTPRATTTRRVAMETARRLPVDTHGLPVQL
ncbi:hypothetical protein MRX96_054531 [Rhipicephalus microplus]